MNTGDTQTQLKKSLLQFLGENLLIETAGEGFRVGMPLMDARGWQVQVQLQPLAPGKWLLSDGGETLGSLEAEAFKTSSGKGAEKVESQCRFYEIERDSLKLQKVISWPADPAEIQIFAEALVAISHLRPKTQAQVAVNVDRLIEDKMNQYFYGRSLKPLRRHKLQGEVEESIVVDFYLESAHPLALQPVFRSRHLRGYMEQWGWRWLDLKAAQPDLIKAMVFDPDNQEWDSGSLRIGEKVCDIFVPYAEAAEALDAALAG